MSRCKRRLLPKASRCPYPCAAVADETSEQRNGRVVVIVGCTSCTICVGASGATNAIASKEALALWEAIPRPTLEELATAYREAISGPNVAKHEITIRALDRSPIDS